MAMDFSELRIALLVSPHSVGWAHIGPSCVHVCAQRDVGGVRKLLMLKDDSLTVTRKSVQCLRAYFDQIDTNLDGEGTYLFRQLKVRSALLARLCPLDWKVAFVVEVWKLAHHYDTSQRCCVGCI